ncbi:MAG: amylo-alpha-1,6-glucosidase [Bacteroidia bacterium]|nr:amylo-alpha-1,6-glucosidase [Bacteroidia bacterium]
MPVPMIAIDGAVLNRFEKAIQHEWLETNGLGGYSCSTVINANTRRYHGLLIAATRPPVGRMVMVSKLEDKVIAGEKTYHLSSNKYRGTIYPTGYIFQKEFKRDIFPEFLYQTNGIEMRKTIVALQGENTVLVLYEVLRANKNFTLELKPLLGARGHHELSHFNHRINPVAIFEDGIMRTRSYPEVPEVFISAPGAHFEAIPDWYYQFEYVEEQKRGQEAHEDLFCPGKLSIPMEAGSKVGLILSTENPQGRDPWLLFEIEKQRRQRVIKKTGSPSPMLQTLSLAADQFLVERGEGGKSIIAGYPWFCDWGRDTMISLPGICLASGRYEEARQILREYAREVDSGMIPNRFPEKGEQPLYNTIDATLWFFVAVYKYLQESGDRDFVEKEIMPVLSEILHWHEKGTRYNIHTDEDGLLCGGVEGVQLTWMDAKCGDWVVTPRIGKAVEVNALWYNAWEIFAYLNTLSGNKILAEESSHKARQIKKQFQIQFWNTEKGCLYDCINKDFRDDAVRPNQIFAISLPFQLMSATKSYQILKKVEEELLTPRGLRSLSYQDSQYHAKYQGDIMARDGAYHQGTVWGWLMGPYIDSVIRIKGLLGKEEARKLFIGMDEHIRDACLGSVSEIFDGNQPHAARGCFAQAWSVAELLRVNHEYCLFGTVPPVRKILRKRKLANIHISTKIKTSITQAIPT